MIELVGRAQDEGRFASTIAPEKLTQFLLELTDGPPMRLRMGLVEAEEVDLDIEFELRWNSFLAIAEA